MSIKVYLAGGFFENEDDWRYDLVKGLNGPIPYRSDNGFEWWGELSQAIFDCIDFVGSFPDTSHFEIRAKAAIPKADIVFWWLPAIERTDLVMMVSDIVYATYHEKDVCIGAPESYTRVPGYFISTIADGRRASFDLYRGSTPEETLKKCLNMKLKFRNLNELMECQKTNPSFKTLLGDKLDKAGYVYVIKADTGHCKIGRTNNVPSRLRLFSVKLPFEFEIINHFPCIDMCESEHYFHGLYASKRTNGEWFNLTSEDIEALKSIGSIDELGICDKEGTPLAQPFDSRSHQ